MGMTTGNISGKARFAGAEPARLFSIELPKQRPENACRWGLPARDRLAGRGELLQQRGGLPWSVVAGVLALECLGPLGEAHVGQDALHRAAHLLGLGCRGVQV
jgi:hypothetical protein